jgi:hypothetical protein
MSKINISPNKLKLLLVWGTFTCVIIYTVIDYYHYEDMPRVYTIGTVLKVMRSIGGGGLTCRVSYELGGEKHEGSHRVMHDDLYPEKGDRFYVGVPVGSPGSGSVMYNQKVPEHIGLPPKRTR